MERTKKSSARPVAAATTVAIPWWNRPITWAIAGIILLLAVVGQLAPHRTPASSTPPEVTAPKVERTPVLSLSGEGHPAAEVHSNNGEVNVNKGQAIVDTNNGVVNIGSINIGTGQPVTYAPAPERVIERVERIVVEKPVERRVYVERKVPVIVDHYPVYVQRDTQTKCEDSAKEHQRQIAKWQSNPFDGYDK